MFGKAIKLFKLFGFEVKVDLSWLLFAVLISWSLGAEFSLALSGHSQTTYWWMGIGAAIGLFLSVVFHELWHSLVARRFGLEMKGITLFIFGGVSEMPNEPASAKVEFWMAIAGPVSSLVLGGVFYGLAWLLSGGAVAPSLSWNNYPSGTHPVVAAFSILGYINVLLTGFNIIPAFPLDGGRVLRAAIWGANKNMLRATRIVSVIGSGFGMLLVVLGIMMFIGFQFPILGTGLISGVWCALIGWFLWGAARSSYQQLLMRKGLEGMKVSKLMEANPITVPRALSIESLVDDYIYKHTFKMFPVVDGDRLAGCVTLQKVRDVPKAEWNVRTVGEIAGGCSPDNTIGPNADAMEALGQMSRGQLSRLMVVEGDKLVGIITLKDMLQFLSVKLELGDK
ncbi:MAG: site-2 protease family protein [Dehalococcoidia bacterium]|nr:site-2 protease family protein [Dehalococcoidia bacterium]